MPNNYQTMLMDWGPRIVGAILILIAAHFLAKGVQWGLAKLIDRVPGVNPHQPADAKRTTGYQLGQLGYWLVLLLGVIAALTMLGLSSVVTPLNTLLTGVLAFIPNVVGAALIFFIGLVVATLARRVVETALNVAHVDRALEKTGVSQMTGASGLAKASGTLVFVLIVIPVTIAALQQLNIRAISDPAVAVLSTVLAAVPRVLAAAIVLGIALLIARWVSGLLEQLLPSLGVDRSLSALGLGQPRPLATDATLEGAPPTTGTASGMTPSKIIARVVLVAIMLFSAVEAARLLTFGAIAVMLAQILELGARVLFGGAIILAGVMIANFLAGLARRSSGGEEGIASTIVRWSTIALASAMGLRFMGLADEIVVIAFALILGAAAVAAALAFGIGGRETARRLLEQWTQRMDTQAGVRRPPEPRREKPLM
ncbi:MAG TPA: mechanosensitive ion channel [Phenylobacterium sp.]|uniref:mechanosensitive ion channel n=1 Tax=Phenylobacterium sp. TaxID=1871053 RepID=UPI002B4A420A|nr:mechanosensitive ion channel [Phenylobacterium sp.]HKR86765.1 mechanosensitive ion channel [Phenylobacterium sp.]